MWGMANVGPDDAERNFCRWVSKVADVGEACLPFPGNWVSYAGGLLIAAALLWASYQWWTRRAADVSDGAGINGRVEPSNQRVPFLEFLNHARSVGWDTNGATSEILDLLYGLRQALADGSVASWGRVLRPGHTKEIACWGVLVEIPRSHWNDFEIDYWRWRGNSDVSTYNFNRAGSWSDGGYVDIHVDGGQALAWLRTDAGSFRGR